MEKLEDRQDCLVYLSDLDFSGPEFPVCEDIEQHAQGIDLSTGIMYAKGLTLKNVTYIICLHKIFLDFFSRL